MAVSITLDRCPMEFVSDDNPKKQRSKFSIQSGSKVNASKWRAFGLLLAVTTLSALVAFQYMKITSMNNQMVNMQNALVLLESRMDDVEGATVDSYTGFSSLNQRVGDLESCVNDYMKTVGDSGGGYYRYYFC
jgi:hypothetical protein